MGASLAVDLRMLEASGIGRYLCELMPRLLRADRHRFALLGDAAAIGRRLSPRPGDVVVEAQAPIYSLSEQVELRRRIPAGTDLFWAPHYNLPLLHRGRLLVTVHDVLHLARPEFVGGAHRRVYARLMFEAVVRKAEAVICVSRFTADELTRLTRGSPRRLEVVHNGVGREWLEPVTGEPPHPRPFLLFVGNVKPHKNLERLVAAFERASGRIPHDLVIVGRRDGFITGDRAVATRAAALGERVRFTGGVSDAELRRFVAHASALVFPSLYEGFGLPPLEAMAAGCPTLVARAGALPEVCGEAALYCDPVDVDDILGKLLLITGEAALRDELVERGRERARAFTWERCATETGWVIDAALA